MSTTSKLGADMQKEILDKLYELRPSDNDRGRHHFKRVADDIRAILARQPAAIDKEAVAICTICNGYGRYQDGNSGTEADGYAPNIVECDCAPEERHPAAPSVEQDAHAHPFAALCDLLPSDVSWGDPLTPDIARHIARAASTSANVAQGAEAVAWREEAQKLFTRCKLWPEKSDDGFMALLELRNHVEKLLKNGALTAAQSASGDTK